MASTPTPSHARDARPAPSDGIGAIRVLQLEDNAVDAELVRRRLEADGLEATYHVVADERSFRAALATFEPHVVLSDFSLHGFDGLSALEIARAFAPSTPFIFVSGTIGEERAIEALKRGATDYVLKDNLRRLVPAIASALRQAQVSAAKELAEEMLKRSQSRLQDIINTSRDWIWECDRQGRFTFSSPSVAEVLGYTQSEIIGHAATDYIDHADELSLQALLEDAATDAHLERPITLRWRHKSGKVRWLERRMVALRDAAGEWRGIRGMDRDVTLRVAQEARIRRLNRALRFLSGASSAGMRIRERDQLIKEACRLAVSVGGYERATIYLLPTDETATTPIVWSYRGDRGDGARWSTGDALPTGVTAVTQALATAEPVIINDLAAESGLALIVTEAPGRARAAAQIALPLLSERSVIGILELDASESGVFGDAELSLLKQVAANIAFSLQYLRSRQDVEYLEYFDALTGLSNRVLFLTRLEAALDAATRHGRHLPLAVIDISELGIVNDSLGHHAGDLVLQALAERLRAVSRDSDALCRLGGDRFAVLGRPGEANPLDSLLSRLQSCFDAPFSVQGHTLHVSMRAGLVLHPEDGRSAEPLLQSAHMALQHAKDTGVRASRYLASMNETASQRFSMMNDLRRAVADKSFVLNYQPKLDLDSGRVGGVEALIRWPNAERSIPPNVFVPILESLGLVDEVGDWVIVAAMTETASWQPEKDFRVAVNVSPLQLNREDFAEHVLASLCELGVDPHRLELEVTESSLMADPGRASHSLGRLRDAGISIAIDDFGTGHSSLRMLTGLPIDVLKIDRSFVRDLTSNRSNRLIVQTTIGLALSLGLKTVAEGVETIEQLEMLQDLGCTAIQGYLLSEPLPAPGLAEWFGSEGLATLRQAVTHPREDRVPTARTGALYVGKAFRSM
jgi:diguanylate cyclase (GGDEF)-like protein/PAS domain S-box-containing protein